MSRQLLKSSGIVGLLTLVSRVMGFARDILIARELGSGGGVDAYFVAQQIPNFGRRVFAEGAFSQAFVPVFTQTKTEGTHGDSRGLIAVVMGTLGAALAVVTLLGCLASPVLIWLFASGFDSDPDKQALAGSLLRWTFPYLMFISLTSMAGGILNSYGRFAIPAFTPVILNLCLIASIFIDKGSVHVLAYAVFVAGILQFLSLLPSLAALDLLPRPRWGWADARVRKILKLMGPIVVGSSVAQISLLLNSNLATHVGDGAVSWLYYASRLMEFPVGIFTIAVGTAILPALSRQHTQGSTASFSATLDWALRMLLLIGCPAGVGLVVLAGPLVATMFARGHFSYSDARMTMYALWAYGVGFMGFSLVRILVPGFYARQETRAPTRYAITGLVVGMSASLLLFGLSRWLDLRAAHVGLAASTSITAWVNSMLLLQRLRRDGIYVPDPSWRRFGFQLLLANLAMGLLLVLLMGNLESWLALGTWVRAAKLFGLILAAVVTYFGVLAALGVRPRDLRTRSPQAV